MVKELEQQLAQAEHRLSQARAELAAIERSKAKRNLDVARIYMRSCEREYDRLRGLAEARR